jgi:hypothetical protein
MRYSSRLLRGIVLCIPIVVRAQSATEPVPAQVSASEAESLLPDAPVPQDGLQDETQSSAQQPTADGSTQSDSGQPGKQDNSGAQASQPPGDSHEEQRQKAREQIKEQEHQRILWIFPAFNTTYRSDAVSLTSKEKMRLALRSAVDPTAFVWPFVIAGFSELNGNAGFGWGPEGYFKRSGAAYLDAFDARMLGKGALPSLLHQDPRYFRRGYGSTTRRLLYASGFVVICKHDVSGRWEPNYSNVGGNILAGMISILYYPQTGESGVQKSFVNGLIVTAQGVFGVMFQEFWPDISRKLLHKDPTRGLDAQREAEDAARKAQQASPAQK